MKTLVGSCIIYLAWCGAELGTNPAHWLPSNHAEGAVFSTVTHRDPPQGSVSGGRGETQILGTYGMGENRGSEAWEVSWLPSCLTPLGQDPGRLGGCREPMGRAGDSEEALALSKLVWEPISALKSQTRPLPRGLGLGLSHPHLHCVLDVVAATVCT